MQFSALSVCSLPVLRLYYFLLVNVCKSCTQTLLSRDDFSLMNHVQASRCYLRHLSRIIRLPKERYNSLLIFAERLSVRHIIVRALIGP